MNVWRLDSDAELKRVKKPIRCVGSILAEVRRSFRPGIRKVAGTFLALGDYKGNPILYHLPEVKERVTSRARVRRDESQESIWHGEVSQSRGITGAWLTCPS